MNPVFFDTSGLVALFDRRDVHHAKALRNMDLIRDKKIPLLLTDYILVESVSIALSYAGHDAAVKVGEFILNSKIVEILWLQESTKKVAWEIFKNQRGKWLSFTDCTSFAVMQERKMNDFFAFDSHFTAAGFTDFSARYGKGQITLG